MKVLKRKFRKKIKKAREEEKPPKRKLTKIKKPAGRWCEYYSGRLPFPIECSTNKNSPISMLYKDGVKK